MYTLPSSHLFVILGFVYFFFFFFSSRRRHTRSLCDWSSDVCYSDLAPAEAPMLVAVLVDNSAAARDDIADIRRALPEFVDAMTASAAAGRKNELSKIGRASCRERVEISVDGGWIEKKRTECKREWKD